MLLAKIGMGFMGTLLVCGAIASSEGFIHVKVHEKNAHGTNLSLVVPAMVMPVAARFLPRRNLAAASANLRPYWPAIDLALSGLRDCQDGLLVEVIDRNSHLTVVKYGDSIIVDADDPGRTVHVALPLGATERTIDEIAEANGPL